MLTRVVINEDKAKFLVRSMHNKGYRALYVTHYYAGLKLQWFELRIWR